MTKEFGETIGIIGGSGLTKLQALEVDERRIVMTPYGEPSAPLTWGRFDGRPVVFLPRHGPGHIIPPHKVGYRANIWALHHVGVRSVIGMAAVGGITLPPGTIAIPDQLIDYTYGREHTFYEADLTQVTHIDFTDPYCDTLRSALIRAGANAGIEVHAHGVYGATQGPRLETAAEIQRLERDGCDMVGMTGMPEAALAREIGLCYANCSVVVNWAAGKQDGPITMSEINANLETGMQQARRLLGALDY
jgi:5'-deoxy-5'-methylthioadenosine phosphorylase